MAENLKTLYLEGGTRPRVMRDGPALRVRARGAADRLFPLRRLAGVVVQGQVEWDTDALLACAEAGVPVSFLRRDGTLRTRVSAAEGAPLPDLGALLRQRLRHAVGTASYRQWVNNRLRESRERLRREMSRAGWSASPSRLAKAVERRAARYVRAPQLRAFDRELAGLVRDEAARLLAEAGVEEGDPLLRLRQIDVARDLADIVGWPLQRAKVSWLKKRWRSARRRGYAWPRLGWRDTVQFFERRRSWIEEELKGLVAELQLELVEGERRDAA